MKDVKSVIHHYFKEKNTTIKPLIKEIIDLNNGISIKKNEDFYNIRKILINKGYPKSQVNQLIEKVVKDISLNYLYENLK